MSLESLLFFFSIKDRSTRYLESGVESEEYKFVAYTADETKGQVSNPNVSLRTSRCKEDLNGGRQENYIHSHFESKSLTYLDH